MKKLTTHEIQQILQDRWPWDRRGTRLPKVLENEMALDKLFAIGSEAFACRKRLMEGSRGDIKKLGDLRQSLHALFAEPERRARFYWGPKFGEGDLGFLALLRYSIEKIGGKSRVLNLNCTESYGDDLESRAAAVRRSEVATSKKPQTAPQSKPMSPRELAEMGLSHLFLFLEAPLSQAHWRLIFLDHAYAGFAEAIFPDRDLVAYFIDDEFEAASKIRDALLKLGHDLGTQRSFVQQRRGEIEALSGVLQSSVESLEKRKTDLHDAVSRLAHDPDALQAEILRITQAAKTQDWRIQAKLILPGEELPEAASEVEAALPARLKRLDAELLQLTECHDKARELSHLNSLVLLHDSQHGEDLLHELKDMLTDNLIGGDQAQLFRPLEAEVYERLDWLLEFHRNPEAHIAVPDSASQMLRFLCQAIRLGVIGLKKKSVHSGGSQREEDLQRRCDAQKEQIGDLLSQMIRKNREVRNLEEKLKRLDKNPAGQSAAAVDALPALKTPLDCIHMAEERFPDDFVFLDSAYESAAESPFVNCGELWKHFEVMAQLTAIWRQNRGSLGDSFHATFKRLGLGDYKGHLSDTAATRHREHYLFTWNGTAQLFEEHFTLGSKDANTCLSLHFLRDEVHHRFIIGHVGRHLPNSQS